MGHSRLARVLLVLNNDEAGQDAAEYGLVVAFIAVVIVVAVAAFGASLAQWFIDLATTMGSYL